MERTVVRNLTRAFVESKIRERGRKGGESFIISDLLGTVWPPELGPFYGLYENQRVAAAEMGKIVVTVARDLGLVSRTEDRFGKKDAITRHFFLAPEKLNTGTHDESPASANPC